MDFQSWVSNFGWMTAVHAFDILPDGTYSEIRVMAYNKQYVQIYENPDFPKFYPGIPYRNYWMDINFEDMLYKCGVSGEPQYAYVNARGTWLKGHYLPISEPGTDTAAAPAPPEEGKPRTVYVLYVLSFSAQVNSDNMSQQSSEVAAAIMNLSIKLHESEDFEHAMATATGEIKKICGAEKSSVYTFDKNTRQCFLIRENGIQQEDLETLAAGMGRTPYEVAEAWEHDLEGSDCMILEDLQVVEERDPAWAKSLREHDVRNIILYAIRCDQLLVGFIWAANYDTSRRDEIKEILAVTTFLIAAVIANHQLVSRLKLKSTVDTLTQVSNRNAMNERVDCLVAGKDALPPVMGVAFVDLNGLKTVNDDEGHDAGDKLLTRAAALLKIAFGDNEVYRAGGDEFVVFCPDTAEEQFEQQIRQLRDLADTTEDISFAVGSTYCTGEYDICRAMQEADGKMYKDKEDYYRLHPEKDRRKRSRG